MGGNDCFNPPSDHPHAVSVLHIGMTLAIAAAILLQLPPIQPFVSQVRSAVSFGNRSNLLSCFNKPADADFLLRMAAERGGLRALKVAAIPAPPGWEATGNYWIVIHTRQDIEDYHDPVFPVILSGERWKLGAEIPEDATPGVQIRNARINARLDPPNHGVQVQASLDLAITRFSRAPLFRLNDNYHLVKAVIREGMAQVIEVGDDIPKPKEGSVVHAGSLLIPWTKSGMSQAVFDYSGTINSPNEDKIDSKACYLTAWWVPTLGRSPFTTSVRVEGPTDWVIESEGKRVLPEDSDVKGWGSPGSDRQVQCFRCDIPISYPKIVAGKYVVAAQKKLGSRTYRAYHFDMTDTARAEKDVATIADAIAWYDEHLGPFPFDEYNCFDADTYYGIESYNYTLLNSRITNWAVSHEAGHTYFGGLVPSAYVHDSWNESMTQYVDSVLHYQNADQTLEGAYASLTLRTPLTEMPVAHEYNSATYNRGAYVLRMLENQIGTDNMYKAIRALIADRRGKDTTWYDLRRYFEKAYGKRLDWFWNQWISGATFPKLEILDAQGIPATSGTQVKVTVRQSGTPSPFHLKLRVFARGINKEVSQVFEMTSPEAVFDLDLGPFKAYEAGIDTFGYVLTPRVAPVKVKQ